MSETVKVQETTKTEQTKSVEIQKLAPIPVKEDGTFSLQNSDDVFRVARGFLESGLLPKQFNSVPSIVTGMQYAQELGLKPLSAMRQIAVVNGTPSIFGDLPLSLCQSSGKMEDIVEFYIDKQGKRISFEDGNILAEKFGAICRVKRVDSEWHETSFTLDDARKAKLYPASKPGTPWETYPHRMLRYRARSQALKDKFPDCLNGLAISEYDFNVDPSEERGPIKVNRDGSKDSLLALTEKIHGNKEVVEAEQ